MADNRITRVSTPAFLQVLTVGFVAFGMLADILSPRIPVSQQSAKYRIFGKNGLMLHEGTLWNPGMIPNAVEARWSSDTYFADIHKLRILLLDSERNNNAPVQLGGMDLEGQYTQTVTQAIAIAREKRVADLFTNPANYAASNKIIKAGGAEWNVVGGEQILTDLITLSGTVADSAMVPRNQISVVIPEPVFRGAIMRNTAILDAVKYTQTGVVTQDLLAALIGVKEVLLSAAMWAGMGPETAGSDVVSGYTTTYLWGDTVWAGLIAQGQNDMVATFSRTFNWTRETGGQARQIRTYRTADEGQEGDWIECKEAIAEKVVYSAAGGIITNTLSTI